MKKYCTAEIRTMFSKAQLVKNLARQKFMLSFVLALMRSRKVQFCEIAQHLNSAVQSISNEGLVIGDREFVGHRWLKFLKGQGSILLKSKTTATKPTAFLEPDWMWCAKV